MKFAFIAKHRGIWPVAWLCEALGVSRSGFHAWLNRLAEQRARDDEDRRQGAGELHRTATALTAPGVSGMMCWRKALSCGLHRIERLMRQTALRARPRRRGLPKDEGDRSAPSSPNVLDRQFEASGRTRSGSPTSPISGRPKAGSMWPPSSTCSHGGSSAGR